MPIIDNSFSENPISIFLKDNLDNQRYFSFDHSMGPNYSAAFQISSIGKISSFNIQDFYTFVPKFIDEDTDPGRLGVPSWSSVYGANDSITKFLYKLNGVEITSFAIVNIPKKINPFIISPYPKFLTNSSIILKIPKCMTHKVNKVENVEVIKEYFVFVRV